jgi:hypothetical protein
MLCYISAQYNASYCASKPRPQNVELDTEIDLMFECPGIPLSYGLQRSFTRVLCKLHAKTDRKSTFVNLDRIRCSVEEISIRRDDLEVSQICYFATPNCRSPTHGGMPCHAWRLLSYSGASNPAGKKEHICKTRKLSPELDPRAGPGAAAALCSLDHVVFYVDA